MRMSLIVSAVIAALAAGCKATDPGHNRGGDAMKASVNALSRDEIMRIADESARKAYRDLSRYEVHCELRSDGWHVDYVLKNKNANGGGAHYVIDPHSGVILKKRHEQ